MSNSNGTSNSKDVAIDLSKEYTRLRSNYGKNLAVTESDMWYSALIFENATQSVHALNVTAKIIWDTFEKNDDLVKMAQEISNWSTAGTNKNQIESDILDFLKNLENIGLLIPLNKGGGFPVGRKINVVQNKKNVTYVSPEIRTFTKSWLEQYHPAAFHDVLFSDTWSPPTP